METFAEDVAHRTFGPPRAWRRADVAADAVHYDLSGAARRQLAAGLERAEARGLDAQSVEPEDVRLPSFASDVGALRARLDDDPGFFVLRGLGLGDMSPERAKMAFWIVANYIGRVIRQNLSGARLDTVSDKAEGRWDPYRLVDTNDRFDTHTDNAFLEPRASDYLGLGCINQAQEGGESLLVSAYALHDALLAESPDWLSRLYAPFHHDLPANQRQAGGAETSERPIFERRDGDLVMHYLRLYIDPGMERAGCPLKPEERAMLDFIDGLMRRDDMTFAYRLEPGEVLFSNNRWLLHGREAFVDHAEPGRHRLLARAWMWRRHTAPGVDPVALDAAEFGAAASPFEEKDP